MHRDTSASTGGISSQAAPLEGLYVIWITGASCDGCTMAMLDAADPGIEDILLCIDCTAHDFADRYLELARPHMLRPACREGC
jgi:Ni,Fe-hydrogenase I small subunit